MPLHSSHQPLLYLDCQVFSEVLKSTKAVKKEALQGNPKAMNLCSLEITSNLFIFMKPSLEGCV